MYQYNYAEIRKQVESGKVLDPMEVYTRGIKVFNKMTGLNAFLAKKLGVSRASIGNAFKGNAPRLLNEINETIIAEDTPVSEKKAS